MSNLPPNPFSNVPGAQMNTNPVTPTFANSQQFGQVPLNQLPPGYAGAKQDANSNSPLHGQSYLPQNHGLQNVNNFSQRASSSPAFNQPGIMPPSLTGQQSSPIKPPMSAGAVKNSLPSNVSSASGSPSHFNANPSPIPYSQNVQPPQRQINDNAPPLVPSSQFNQPLINGPYMGPMSSASHLPVSSAPFTSAAVFKPSFPPGNHPPLSTGYSSVSKPSGPMTTAFATPLSGPHRNSPLLQGPNGPPVNGPPTGMPLGFMEQTSANGPSMPPVTGPHKPLISGLPPASKAGPYVNGPTMSGPPISGQTMGGQHMAGPPMGMQPASGTPFSQPMAGQPSRPPITGPSSGPAMSVPPIRPPTSGPAMQGPLMSGPPLPGPVMTGAAINRPPMTGPNTPFPGPSVHPMNRPGPMGPPTGPQSLPATFPPSGPQSLPAQFPGPTQPPLMGNQMGLPSGPSQPPVGPPCPPTGPLNGPQKTNMQSRYPQMQQPPMQTNMAPQYPQQYNTQNMTQQMGNLSVTKQGFDQLWGHQMVDLMQCKHILPEYPEDPPEIKLGPQFPDAVNCSPDVFRCTVNRIPETNNLLQKSRLPLGILIHPFKDLNHLPVIQCNTIVRCRSCRTYINPFVYFVDAKRWKCNLCFRVNDLPEEFLFDPVSKSYGDPARRPEIKSATIEFIAPGEYMLRPPQPAVYLFLLDVSQIARESGYLQVVCDTLKACLDELPGDARTQIGFICFDSHVHYYLMSEGLTRPKEMTVLDIEDIFLPSPESLLVNLGERREMVRELLTVLGQRYSSPGPPASALGAALQAAYKLMAPTGGRVTVFQTCLPNTGPGALQPREDPNARSSKDVAHLNPATDFYKRLALDCSGAQVAVDLFLLNSQYSDLATLSGISKFSGGSVYHIPLFKASRAWQADQLNRMFNRYLTRKIGFEAVMRVRATRGITIHTFHGNFFVRSTDLLSLPNVSPDAGFGMQLTIEESLHDLQHVCFQAALLYTSSKGERRIRVHTMSLPIATTLPDVLHSADTQCIIGLLSKMAVDRAQSASLSEAREAVMHVAVEALSAHRLAANLPVPAASAALHAPHTLRLLPMYLLALLKTKAFRTGTSTRLDDRVADMCALKSQPLAYLLRAVYPNLYPVHTLQEHLIKGEDDEVVSDPPRLQLSAERINSTGAYLLDDGETMIIYVCRNVSPAFLSETFGVTAFSQIPDEARSLPKIDSDTSALLHSFIERLNDDRPYASDILVLRDNSPSRNAFTERLVEDRVESSFSYYEFLQHVKNQVK